MAQYQSHISFSGVVGLAYAVFGYYFLHIYYEHLILGFALILIAGMLPDLDAGQGNPAKELSGFIAAISPVILFELFPKLRMAGSARIALILIVCYFSTRIIILRALQTFTTHRGVIHSIPAAIICFQLSYFLFSDMYWLDQVYVSAAVAIGFLSHLILDAYSNLDILGSAMGKRSSGAPALKLLGPTWGSTIFIYGLIAILGYFMINDYLPQIKIQKTKIEVKAVKTTTKK